MPVALAVGRRDGRATYGPPGRIEGRASSIADLWSPAGLKVREAGLLRRDQKDTELREAAKAFQAAQKDSSVTRPRDAPP